MFTRAFVRDLAERVIATFCESWAALLLADGAGLLDSHWTTSLSVAGMTALVTLLKGVAAGYKEPETGASLLSDPPPRVESGHNDVVVAVLAAVALLAVLALAGFFR